jgi:hypothetical protein
VVVPTVASLPPWIPYAIQIITITIDVAIAIVDSCIAVWIPCIAILLSSITRGVRINPIAIAFKVVIKSPTCVYIAIQVIQP